jgi:hypothetical protein
VLGAFSSVVLAAGAAPVAAAAAALSCASFAFWSICRAVNNAHACQSCGGRGEQCCVTSAAEGDPLTAHTRTIESCPPVAR